MQKLTLSNTMPTAAIALMLLCGCEPKTPPKPVTSASEGASTRSLGVDHSTPGRTAPRPAAAFVRDHGRSAT